MYSLQQTAKLLRDIDQVGRLAEGGSQYPNGECCHDGANTLLAIEKSYNECLERLIELEEVRKHEKGYYYWVATGERLRAP